jgi:glycosyltransferase involved in cell wall biosynthesis
MRVSNGHIRIVHVITRSDSLGGAQVHVLDLAEALVGKGHEVTVFLGGNGPVANELERRGVPYRSIRHLARPLNPVADVLAGIEICQALRTTRPHLVAAHTAKAGMLARWAAAACGVPTVFTPHGWAIADRISARRGRLFALLERLGGCISARIINVCEYERGLAMHHQIAPEAKLAVIHNGIPDVTSNLMALPSSAPPRLITVARFEEPKDYRTLLTALSQLTDLPWTINLVGDGPLLRLAQRLAADLGLSGRVHFLGTRSDVPRLLADAQLFVLSTRSEAFPYTVLEAMRAGLPVVSSDVGGIREAVADGVTGMLVPPRDPAALRDRLRQLILDPALRGSLGSASRRVFLEQFTLNKMVDKTIQVYREVLSTNRVPTDALAATSRKLKWPAVTGEQR